MKVCLAIVNNHTAELLYPDRMTAQLAKAVHDKHSALAMETATSDSRKLEPTLENSEEMKSKDISIGHARVPSVYASDSLGGESGPVYRNELEINFAACRATNPSKGKGKRVR